MSEESLTRVDRRTTLRWLAATLGAGAVAACGDSGAQKRAADAAARAVADLGVPKPISGQGYGRYPDTRNPTVTWERTMTEAQLRLTRKVADLIVPADDVSPSAGQLGVQDFIDEWVSAPYAGQRADREQIFAGLTWLEQEAMDRADGARFFAAGRPVQEAILDDIAYKDRVKPGLEEQAAFFHKLRYLVTSAFYASEEGWADLGYRGNMPTTGPYPGPTKEALGHLERGLKSRGLTLPALAEGLGGD